MKNKIEMENNKKCWKYLAQYKGPELNAQCWKKNLFSSSPWVHILLPCTRDSKETSHVNSLSSAQCNVWKVQCTGLCKKIAVFPISMWEESVHSPRWIFKAKFTYPHHRSAKAFCHTPGHSGPMQPPWVQHTDVQGQHKAIIVTVSTTKQENGHSKNHRIARNPHFSHSGEDVTYFNTYLIATPKIMLSWCIMFVFYMHTNPMCIRLVDILI